MNTRRSWKTVRSIMRPLVVALAFLCIAAEVQSQVPHRFRGSSSSSSHPSKRHDGALTRQLQEDDGTDSFSGIGEDCNEKKQGKQCASGLTCTRVPSLSPFGGNSKCFPIDCLATAVDDFNHAVNITQYQDQIFQNAHVTRAEFFQQSSEKGKRPLTAWSAAKHMRTSDKVRRVMQTIIDNPIPRDEWQSYETALQACDPDQRLSARQTSALIQRGPSEPGILGTVGLGVNAGAVLGGSLDFFWSYAHDNPTPFFFINLGGGLTFGADAGGSAFLGMVFTGDSRDVPGVGFELEIEIPIPVVGPGVRVGVDLQNVWNLDFLLGVGVGLSVGSFNAGYTWGFPSYNETILPEEGDWMVGMDDMF